MVEQHSQLVGPQPQRMLGLEQQPRPAGVGAIPQHHLVAAWRQRVRNQARRLERIEGTRRIDERDALPMNLEADRETVDHHRVDHHRPHLRPATGCTSIIPGRQPAVQMKPPCRFCAARSEIDRP
jgi:hypothetical protein